MGVDPSTLARWERGEREPVGAFAEERQSFCAKWTISVRPTRVGRRRLTEPRRQTLFPLRTHRKLPPTSGQDPPLHVSYQQRAFLVKLTAYAQLPVGARLPQNKSNAVPSRKR